MGGDRGVGRDRGWVEGVGWRGVGGDSWWVEGVGGVRGSVGIGGG